jgi:hypothetical protein
MENLCSLLANVSLEVVRAHRARDTVRHTNKRARAEALLLFQWRNIVVLVVFICAKVHAASAAEHTGSSGSTSAAEHTGSSGSTKVKAASAASAAAAKVAKVTLQCTIASDQSGVSGSAVGSSTVSMGMRDGAPTYHIVQC